MSDSYCNVKLDLNEPPHRSFTFRDKISGTVTLEVTKELSTDEIFVKFIGETEVAVSGPDPEHAIDQQHRLRDYFHHLFLNEYIMLLTTSPGMQMYKSMEDDMFTIPKGSYMFDISFVIPTKARTDDNAFKASSQNARVVQRAQQFPPWKSRTTRMPVSCSFIDQKYGQRSNVRYSISVSMSRLSWTGAMKFMEFKWPVEVIMPGPTRAFINQIKDVRLHSDVLQLKFPSGEGSIYSRSSSSSDMVDVVLQMTCKQSLRQGPQDIKFHLLTNRDTYNSSTMVKRLKGISISIKEVVKVTGQHLTRHHVKSRSEVVLFEASKDMLRHTIDFANSEPYDDPDDKFTSILDITELISPITLDKLTPSFHSTSFKACYMWDINLKLGDLNDGMRLPFAKTDSLKLQSEIDSCGESWEDKEYVKIFGGLHRGPYAVTL